MNNQTLQFAIVDIETTGGNARASRITEIAIRILDEQGTQIDHFESLINPEQPIPLNIRVLTEIDDQMVAQAPLFAEVAQRIYNMLSGCVFVAHNVNFDYSFLKNEFEKSGYTWESKRLCTVRLSRRIYPGFKSYSLGRLCDRLNIPHNDRHRAGGDADATTLLFQKLLVDGERQLLEVLSAKSKSSMQLPTQLDAEKVYNLPVDTGIYHFRDARGKVIYVGKAKNLKKRVLSHFSGHNTGGKRQAFLNDIADITHEACGTELIALLKECAVIQKLWPKFNNALKRFQPKFGLYVYERTDGYLQLSLGTVNRHGKTVKRFYQIYEGVRWLNLLVRQFDLIPTFYSYGPFSNPDKSGINNRDNTVMLPEIVEYNRRVENALNFIHEDGKSKTFAIIDKGRTPSEKSCIWVENGELFGIGFFERDGEAFTSCEVKDRLERIESNQYVMHLISNFAERYPEKIWIPDAVQETFN